MKIRINGEMETVEAPCTVRALLAARGMGEAACAVEINREVVPRREHDEREVRDGDEIEIVSLVGGG